MSITGSISPVKKLISITQHISQLTAANLHHKDLGLIQGANLLLLLLLLLPLLLPLLLLLLLLLFTVIELSLGGSSPYTSTDKTNKNKYPYKKQYKKRSTNNKKHSKCKYTYYQNTHTLQKKQVKTTTVQVKTNTVQDIPK
jgi:hypothetical protein